MCVQQGASVCIMQVAMPAMREVGQAGERSVSERQFTLSLGAEGTDNRIGLTMTGHTGNIRFAPILNFLRTRDRSLAVANGWNHEVHAEHAAVPCGACGCVASSQRLQLAFAHRFIPLFSWVSCLCVCVWYVCVRICAFA